MRIKYAHSRLKNNYTLIFYNNYKIIVITSFDPYISTLGFNGETFI